MHTSPEESQTTTPALFAGLHRYVWAYLTLGKWRLSLTVTLSALVAYLLAVRGYPSWLTFFLLAAGGWLIAMSANAVNQYLEQDIDRQMQRTARRPLITGALTEQEALAFSIITFLVGSLFLLLCDPVSLVIAWCAWLIYLVGYTRFKRKYWWAMELGALAGALPVLIGWWTGQHNLALPALLLFAAQWIWQYPHTWGFLARYREDFRRIGIQLWAPPAQWYPWLATVLVLAFALLSTATAYALQMGTFWIFSTAVWSLIGSFAILWFGLRKRNDTAIIVTNLLLLPVTYVWLVVGTWFNG